MFGLFKKNKPENHTDFSKDEDDELKAYIPREQREHSYKEAQIKFPTGYVCRGIVVDYSEGGVRMRFQNIEYLPEFVHLSVPSLRLNCKVRVAWHDTIDYGLEFCEPVNLPH